MVSRFWGRGLVYLAAALVVYMPMHVFMAQSASAVTGGMEAWKAGKDVVVFLLAPLLLYLSWRQGLWKDRFFRIVLGLGLVYGLIHGLYLLFDVDDHTNTTLIASVYNTRLLVYLLIGYLVGSAWGAERYAKKLFWFAAVVAIGVAVFGVLQYFVLPHDFLENFGYTLDRGVKPLFFIDDKPDLPRVMSTLKDPNSLGAYLIVPTLSVGYAMLSKSRGGSKQVFGREVDQKWLACSLVLLLTCLAVTFSRGALIALAISTVTILYIATRERRRVFIQKISLRYLIAGLAVIVAGLIALPFVWQTYLFQNLVFHADDSTVLADPNELRVQLVQDAIDDVADQPLGHGPGTAGIVGIRNPKGGVLTENYYLQIAYEVGWLGITLFVAIMSLIIWRLHRISRDNVHATILISAGAGYLFYSLLIHLWSNEAIALHWWLLAGVTLARYNDTKQRKE